MASLGLLTVFSQVSTLSKVKEKATSADFETIMVDAALCTSVNKKGSPHLFCPFHHVLDDPADILRVGFRKSLEVRVADNEHPCD
eukprot:1160789-Pelagomonas_calceolata.AAC.7